MCSKREERAVLQPIADLHEEFLDDKLGHILADLDWAGARVFFGTLENV